MEVKRPALFVISAPSGAGKTTISKEILRRHPDILFSVSATTRAKRSGELHGRDYFFLTKDEFDERISRGELVEWEELFGHYYGTLRSQIDGALAHGRSMLFDIDVKGALSIKGRYPRNAVLFFIEPPSLEGLTERLNKRMTETGISMRSRLERVPMEMEMKTRFDYSVVNDDLSTAIDAVDRIITTVMQEKSGEPTGA